MLTGTWQVKRLHCIALRRQIDSTAWTMFEFSCGIFEATLMKRMSTGTQDDDLRLIVQPLPAENATHAGYPKAAICHMSLIGKLRVQILAQNISCITQRLRLLARTDQHAHQQIFDIPKTAGNIVRFHNKLDKIMQINVL